MEKKSKEEEINGIIFNTRYCGNAGSALNQVGRLLGRPVGVDDLAKLSDEERVRVLAMLEKAYPGHSDASIIDSLC